MERTHVLQRSTPIGIVARLAWVAVAALVAVGGLTVSSRAQTTTNTAIEWNAIASTAIMTTAAQPPHVAVISLAMVQGAVYDAVNAIDGGYQPYLVAPPADPGDSMEAAAATAAFRVLVGFPERTPPLAGLVPTQLAGSSRSTTHPSRACPTGPRRRAGSRSAKRPRPRCSRPG